MLIITLPRNRHWRMSFCCKGGKAAVLRPTARFATAPGSGTSNAHVFLDTLVCNVSPSARLLQMPDPLPMAGGGGGRGPVAAAAVLPAGGLRVAWKHDAADANIPPDQLEGGQGARAWPRGARCGCRPHACPAVLCGMRCKSCAVSASATSCFSVQLIMLQHRVPPPPPPCRAEAAGGGGAALH